jgi:hypothetical protein
MNPGICVLVSHLNLMRSHVKYSLNSLANKWMSGLELNLNRQLRTHSKKKHFRACYPNSESTRGISGSR